MRFSISASSSISWRRRSSCSRSSGVPWSRSGSVGGSRASSRRTCVSSCCCVSCSCSICFLRVLVGVAELGQRRGRQRRGGAAGLAPRRRRPGWPGRSPAPCSGASPERELTRITSSGVSWKMRLKPSGSTKRTSSSAPCTAERDGQRDLQRRERGAAHRASVRPRRRLGDAAASPGPARPRRRRPRSSAGRRPARRPRLAAASASARGRAAASRRATTLACRSSVSRSVPPSAHAHPRCRAASGSAPAARNTSGSVVGANQAVLHHRGVELADAVLRAASAASSSARSRPGSRCSRRRRRRSRR